MTDNEIIEALECCIKDDEDIYEVNACNKCMLHDDTSCTNHLRDLALDLINRQQMEIDRLKSMNQAKLDTIHDLQVEVERLTCKS